MITRRLVAAVIGDASLEDPIRIEEARSLGAALVEAKFRIVTGGMGGVMEAVCFGARHSPAWTDGSTVGILPSYRASDANPWCDVVIPTGLQLGRNVLVVSSADVVVALGGGAGTLSEIALACQLARPVIALGEAGWAGKLAGQAVDPRRGGTVRGCTSIAETVAACLELAAVSRDAGDIGSGFRKRES